MEEEPWKRHHGGGIMEEESWKRNHGRGIMEEESWRRNHGGGIREEESGQGQGQGPGPGIWGAFGRHFGRPIWQEWPREEKTSKSNISLQNTVFFTEVHFFLTLPGKMKVGVTIHRFLQEKMSTGSRTASPQGSRPLLPTPPEPLQQAVWGIK